MAIESLVKGVDARTVGLTGASALAGYYISGFNPVGAAVGAAFGYLYDRLVYSK